MKIKDSHHIYAFTTIFCWSLAYVLTRLCLRYYSPLALGFLRYFVASVVLLAGVLIFKPRPPRREDIKWFLAAGATGFFLYISLFNIGSQSVNVSTSSVIIATVPAVTAVLARLVYKEKLSRRQWLASGLEFLGVALLALLDGIFSFNNGLVWLFLAVFLFSAYNLIQRRLSQSYNALQASAYVIFAGTLMLAVFLPASLPQLMAAPPAQIFYLIALGTVASAVPYLAWAQAYAKAKQITSVSNYMFLTPLITTLFGFVLIGEKPDLPTILGGALILGGLLIFNFDPKRTYFTRRTHKHVEKSGGGGTI